MVTTEQPTDQHTAQTCSTAIKAVKDALDVLSGRWKLLVLLSLIYGPKRFRQISRDVNGITDKVLSKELKDLEMNQLISRTVYDSFPPMVEYAITEHGSSLKEVIAVLGSWGRGHRYKIIGQDRSDTSLPSAR
ncbi:MAG: helix-turn-helix transcriptional regulator [Bacteroidetes bacterium]|nr:helix-turn-helix transcriptional regulator [Fibrella sp.]